MILPAITLWQPYAMLPFFGAKPWETRTRPFPVKYAGRRIVIHAAAAYAPKGVVGECLHDLCNRTFGEGYRDRLPRGVALGSITLGQCCPVEEVRDTLSADDLAAGDFSDGRWAWRWVDAELFHTPITCRGWQGWGKFDTSIGMVDDLV